jgi:hypothetical protein
MLHKPGHTHRPPDEKVKAAGTELDSADATAQGLDAVALPVADAETTDKALKEQEADPTAMPAVLGGIRSEMKPDNEKGTTVIYGREFVFHPATNDPIDVTDYHEIRIGMAGNGTAWANLVDHGNSKQMGPSIPVASIFEARALKARAEPFFVKRRALGA